MYLRYKTLSTKKLAMLNLEEIAMTIEDNDGKSLLVYGFFNNEQTLSENYMELFLRKLHEAKTSKLGVAPVFNDTEKEINRDLTTISFGKNSHIFLDKTARDALWKEVADAVNAKEAIFDIDVWYDKYCDENEVSE